MVFYYAERADQHTQHGSTGGSPCELSGTLTGLHFFNKMSPRVTCLHVTAMSNCLRGPWTLTLRFCTYLPVHLWTNTSLQTTLQPALDYTVFLWLVFKNATFSLYTELETKAWILNTLETRCIMLWGERNYREARDSVISYPGEIPQDTAGCRFLKMNTALPCL